MPSKNFSSNIISPIFDTSSQPPIQNRSFVSISIKVSHSIRHPQKILLSLMPLIQLRKLSVPLFCPVNLLYTELDRFQPLNYCLIIFIIRHLKKCMNIAPVKGQYLIRIFIRQPHTDIQIKFPALFLNNTHNSKIPFSSPFPTAPLVRFLSFPIMIPFFLKPPRHFQPLI